jgi:hypothetical protein
MTAGFAPQERLFAERARFSCRLTEYSGRCEEGERPLYPSPEGIWLLAMRAETERTIEEIKQALSLLRRHL